MPFKEDSSLLKRRAGAAIPCVFAVLAFLCSYVGNFYCDNIQFVPQGNIDHADFFRPRPISFGLWMYKKQKITDRMNGQVLFTESCEGYPEDVEMDTHWKVARAFSCLSVISAGFLNLWQLASPFLMFDGLYWRWATGLFVIIGSFQSLTLFYVRSTACSDNPLIELMVPNMDIYPSECSWDWGSRASLTSAILYALTVISMLIIPAPGMRPNERQFPMMVWDDDEEEESVESFEHSDDEDSIDSFACDYEEGYPQKQQRNNNKNNARDETDRDMTDFEDSSYDDSSYGASGVSSITDMSDFGRVAPARELVDL